MSPIVSVIGSFRKFYKEICDIIDDFSKQGICVLSPKKSEICNIIDDFVVFKYDNPAFSPEEIQMITLEKILNSDAVFVYNPNGYIGKTTCYEIGFCLSRSVPLFFLEKPKDLPIPFSNKQIVSVEEFSRVILGETFPEKVSPNLNEPAMKSYTNVMGLSEEKHSEKNKIVICGSMSFYDKMRNIKDFLQSNNVVCVIPEDESNIYPLFNGSEAISFKRRVSNSYLRKIRDKSTVAILVYNDAKNNVRNYIGPNTLVEIAMAFMWNRKIFLFDGVYAPLCDELEAWNCISLNRDFSDLLKFMQELNKDIERKNENYQLTLFD